MALLVYKKSKPRIISPRRSRPFVVPIILFITGISILGYAAYPYIRYSLSRAINVDSYSKELISPLDVVSAKTITTNANSISTDYNTNVEQSIADIDKEIKTQSVDPALASETGKMYLNIPKINLKNVPININTNSGSERDYSQFLYTGVAHFKGTSLPGHDGKTFIYGHSGSGILNGHPYTNIFNNLDSLNLGDEFTIKYKDVSYKYMVTKLKAVETDDISVIQSTDKKTVSLMTCIPPGQGQQRLVVEAVEEDNDI